MSPLSYLGEDRGLSARLWRRQGATVITPPARSHVHVFASTQCTHTRPLLWTGLREPPPRVTWFNAPTAESYALEIDTNAGSERYRAERASFAWPKSVNPDPDEAVHWRIAAAGAYGRGVEGTFWLLPPHRIAQLRAAEEVIADIDEIEMRAIAQAFTTAQFGLYDDAMSLLDALLTLLPSNGRVALVQRSYLAILADMQEKLPVDSNQLVRDWIQARARTHLESLSKALPARLNVGATFRVASMPAVPPQSAALAA